MQMDSNVDCRMMIDERGKADRIHHDKIAVFSQHGHLPTGSIDARTPSNFS
jgi:hypothetical protein